jgi:hypothetical protein
MCTSEFNRKTHLLFLRFSFYAILIVLYRKSSFLFFSFVSLLIFFFFHRDILDVYKQKKEKKRGDFRNIDASIESVYILTINTYHSQIHLYINLEHS